MQRQAFEDITNQSKADVASAKNVRPDIRAEF